MSTWWRCSETTRPCCDCGGLTQGWNSCLEKAICRECQQRRDDAYDDFVDPAHWYHQHNPDRACEP